MKNINYLFVVSSFVCFVIFLFHLFWVGTAIYGDGTYYYSIARSLAIDGDINFKNEFSYFGIDEPLLPSGYPANKYPPGVSFIWLPTIFLTHQVLTILKNSGVNTTNNGFSLPYQISIAAVTVTVTIFGVYLLFKTLRLFFNQKISLIASFTTLFMTNLFFYSSFDVINSHAISFAFSSLFLYLLFRFPNKNIFVKWFMLGIVSGIIALIRSQDFILSLPALFFLFILKQPYIRKAIALVLFFLGNLLTFLPQLFIWQVIYGKFYTSPYLQGEGFSFLRPEFIGVLLNRDTGLILWTPVVFLGIVGLFYLPKKLYSIRNIFLITFFLQFYTIASWSSWNQGGSFGARMLVSSLPIVSFGIAWLTEKFLQKFNFKKTIVGLVLFFLLNFSLIVTYLLTH